MQPAPGHDADSTEEKQSLEFQSPAASFIQSPQHWDVRPNHTATPMLMAIMAAPIRVKNPTKTNREPRLPHIHAVGNEVRQVMRCHGTLDHPEMLSVNDFVGTVAE